jgi:hypothetical protein
MEGRPSHLCLDSENDPVGWAYSPTIFCHRECEDPRRRAAVNRWASTPTLHGAAPPAANDASRVLCRAGTARRTAPFGGQCPPYVNHSGGFAFEA